MERTASELKTNSSRVSFSNLLSFPTSRNWNVLPLPQLTEQRASSHLVWNVEPELDAGEKQWNQYSASLVHAAWPYPFWFLIWRRSGEKQKSYKQKRQKIVCFRIRTPLPGHSSYFWKSGSNSQLYINARVCHVQKTISFICLREYSDRLRGRGRPSPLTPKRPQGDGGDTPTSYAHCGLILRSDSPAREWIA